MESYTFAVVDWQKGAIKILFTFDESNYVKDRMELLAFHIWNDGQIIMLNNLISSNLVLFYQIVLWVQMSDSCDFDGFWYYISTMAVRFLRNSCNLFTSICSSSSLNVNGFPKRIIEMARTLHPSVERERRQNRTDGPGVYQWSEVIGGKLSFTKSEGWYSTQCLVSRFIDGAPEQPWRNDQNFCYDQMVSPTQSYQRFTLSVDEVMAQIFDVRGQTLRPSSGWSPIPERPPRRLPSPSAHHQNPVTSAVKHAAIERPRGLLHLASFAWLITQAAMNSTIRSGAPSWRLQDPPRSGIIETLGRPPAHQFNLMWRWLSCPPGNAKFRHRVHRPEATPYGLPDSGRFHPLNEHI
jgi:hypothetical protein